MFNRDFAGGIIDKSVYSGEIVGDKDYSIEDSACQVSGFIVEAMMVGRSQPRQNLGRFTARSY